QGRAAPIVAAFDQRPDGAPGPEAGGGGPDGHERPGGAAAGRAAVTYLLDVNALIALGITTHEFHQRVDAWIATLDSPAARLATCAVTELAFVRIVPQLPGLGASVAQAKELLRRLKRQQRSEERRVGRDGG